jgi:type I restriction enzyme M protein
VIRYLLDVGDIDMIADDGIGEISSIMCPVRGVVRLRTKRSNDMTPVEEHYRVQAITHLLRLGYPKENFVIEAVVKSFGNSGRNSMRADFAVLNTAARNIASGDIEGFLSHAILLAEIKRENKKSEYVKATQVKPLLDFAKVEECLAVYWDNAEQRVFWSDRSGGVRETKEGPIAMLPRYGRTIEVKPITFELLKPVESLVAIFDKIEDILHSVVDSADRYEVMLQLILAKLHDEHGHRPKPATALGVQDYRAIGLPGLKAIIEFNEILGRAVSYYEKHLPRPVGKTLPKQLKGDVLLDIAEVLAPICLSSANRDVVQAFYMRFAKGMYKWDLAQFFTPPTSTDFIIDVLDPGFDEHIKDPACGSADFLAAAYARQKNVNPGYSACIWGTDISKNAVQVAVLNMVLNGDGKSNIREADALATVDDELDMYDIMVCNPPFGVKIVEKSTSTLSKFDLGHEWIEGRDGKLVKLDALSPAQETGLLFAELCVKQAKSGTGRIGLIVPNGYLGNRKMKYRVFREWLLRHCRVAAICSFPRFAFKTSGADVSASILFLEKRRSPLLDCKHDTNYQVSVQMIENVGWNLGDKKAAPRYMRNPEDGGLIEADGKPLLDSDFQHVLKDIKSSAASDHFPWISNGGNEIPGHRGWSINISAILNDANLTMDPKRHCRKYAECRAEVAGRLHARLSDLVDFAGEKKTWLGVSRVMTKARHYDYVEIADMGFGDFKANSCRGWELPSRAKHFAEAGDIFIGSIWGSVTKWCLVPKGLEGLVFTNGCQRLRIKPGKEKHLTDLIAYLCTESYAVQMRGIARGSDGLAEVTAEDTGDVLVPILSEVAREELTPFVERMLMGAADLKSRVGQMVHSGAMTLNEPPRRSSHASLV